MRSLLVVSQASVNEPHRRVYDLLARKSDWRVDIVCPEALPVPGGFKSADPAPDDARYRLYPLPMYLQHQGRLQGFRGLGRLALKLRPAAILAEYDPGSAAILHAWAASRLSGARVVAFTPENIERNRIAEAWRGLMSGGPIKGVFRDVTVAALDLMGRRVTAGLACMNPEGRRIFEHRQGWSKPIDVIPLGVDLSHFRPMDQSELKRQLGLNGFVVGYFGRLVREKGVHVLIEALQHMPSDVRLLLDMFTNFAPGSYAAELMAGAERLGVKDRITTIDVPHAEVARYMNLCDAVVLPSLSSERWLEQYGRVLPEAMACGVPVIGSDSGNIPNMIGDAGLIVAQGSAEQLARAVIRLRDDPDAHEKYSSLGIERVRSRFSAEVQVELTLALLERCMPADSNDGRRAGPSHDTRSDTAPSS